MRATLHHFAQVNDAVAATTKKLVKQSLLGDYLRELNDVDLRWAIRFAAGRAFSSTDERVLNVGWAIVTDAVLPILGLSPQAYHDLVVTSGEIGEALSRAWPSLPPPAPQVGMTLRDLADAFDDLAATGSQARKREVLSHVFANCTQPREAAYVAKIISGDLRTGVQEGVLQAAIAKAFGRELAQVQHCQLLVGDLDEVAVLARADALDTAAFRLFHPIQFMLANPRETPAIAADVMGGRTFYAEDKLDGIRAQIHKSGNRIAIYTRTMDRADASFPDVVDAMQKLSGDFLLDGEIVPWRAGRVLPFANIQKRLGRKVLTASILRDRPVAFVAFDLLYRDGSLLMECPLSTRRASLETLIPLTLDDADASNRSTPVLTTRITPVSTAEQIEATFAAARDRRNEGIVLKDPQSIYSPGRRSQASFKRDDAESAVGDGASGMPESTAPATSGKRQFSGWIKLKTTLPTLDCVVVAVEYGHGRRRSVLSDYTFAIWDKPPSEEGARLVNVGKAFNGLTDKEIADMTEVFLSIAVERAGRVFAVQRQIVIEVAFDQIQKSERHASGYALRFPRIVRLRPDKRPEDADLLARVAELYTSIGNFGQSEPETRQPEPSLFD